MRRRGMTPESIEAALLAENASRCTPPLPDEEVRRIALSVGRYEPEPATGAGLSEESMPDPLLWPDVTTLESAAREWVADDFIPAGTIGMITSGPGEGKSFLSLNLAVCRATGTRFAGRDVQKGPVLYLDAENPPAEIRERLLEGFNLTRTPDNLHIAGSWCEFGVPNPCGADLQKWILESDPKPLIIMDTLADFTGAKDENEAAANGRYLTSLRTLASAGATIMLLHHVPKARSAPYRGNSIILAKMDYAYELMNAMPGSPLGRIQLRAFKRRVSVPESLFLDWNSTTGNFDAVELSPLETNAEVMRRVLAMNPGAGKKALIEAGQKAGVSWHRADSYIRDGIETGLVRLEKLGNSHRYYLGASNG